MMLFHYFFPLALKLLLQYLLNSEEGKGTLEFTKYNSFTKYNGNGNGNTLPGLLFQFLCLESLVDIQIQIDRIGNT